MVSPSAAILTPPPNPRAHLVRRERSVAHRTWHVDLPERGVWKITGQAGSGVTSFLIDTAAARIAAGADPNGVLFITPSKESGARVRAELSDKLAASGFVVEEPLVRSVHSLAFALLRAAGEADEQIRLISGAEQDFAIRELLQGHAEDGAGTWPAELCPALPMVGFARQLRDFLLRSVERTLTPEQLRQLGQQHGIAVWTAAGDFLAEYQQIMALYGARSYSASELVAEALRVPLARTWHTVLVDDAQHLDPASGALVHQLVSHAELAVAGGDLDQAVFRFRGASPHFFACFERDAAAGAGQAAEVSLVDLGESRRRPAAEIAIAPNSAVNHAVVVNHLRRAHLQDDVAWRDMAVVVRSAGMIEPLRRALLHAGVPVAVNPTDIVLGEQRIVAAMLLGLRALTQELTAAQWRELILGPVGGADPVTLRRLMRGLRRWRPESRADTTLQELLVQADELPEFGTMLTDRELAILRRIRAVLDSGRVALADGGSVEEVLWAIWSATGLAEALMAVALRGGASGSQADRDLDAMMALFDAAGDFTERRPSATVESFIAHILEQELPTGVRDRRAAVPDAVPLLTAHGVAGREFRRVVISGVQELSWPTLTETGTLLRQEDLIDLIDEGIDPDTPVSHIADRLHEERRLFHVAVTRATEQVLVTAVDDPDGDVPVEPSRFIEEFAAQRGVVPEEIGAVDEVRAVVAERTVVDQQPALFDSVDDGDEIRVDSAPVRVLAVEEFVAELRRAITDDAADEATKLQAARQLARMAEEGIAGADPAEWWTTTNPSTDEPVDPPKRLSPSRIEGLLDCPLRGVLERDIAPATSEAMTRGTLVHYFFEAVGRGADPELARADTVAAYRTLFDVPTWKEENDLAAFTRLLDRAAEWIDSTRGAFELAGVEVPVHVEVSPGLVIGGRVDRLERERTEGEPADAPVHVVDLKTSTTAPTNGAMTDHAQLFAYQLALSNGVLRDGEVVTAGDGETPLASGGGTLVFPASKAKGITTRQQAPKNAEELAEFSQRISGLPEEMTGPRLRAVTGDHCALCTVRSVCPAQPEGEVTTRG